MPRLINLASMTIPEAKHHSLQETIYGENRAEATLARTVELVLVSP